MHAYKHQTFQGFGKRKVIWKRDLGCFFYVVPENSTQTNAYELKWKMFLFNNKKKKTFQNLEMFKNKVCTTFLKGSECSVKGYKHTAV